MLQIPYVLFICRREGSSLEDVVEKQADLIEYLKQRNTSLSKRLLNLTAQHWPQSGLPLPVNQSPHAESGRWEDFELIETLDKGLKPKEIPIHTSTCAHRLETGRFTLTWDGQITQEEEGGWRGTVGGEQSWITDQRWGVFIAVIWPPVTHACCCFCCCVAAKEVKMFLETVWSAQELKVLTRVKHRHQ